MNSVPPVTRRRFLRQAAAACGAAFTAPALIPASALGRNGLVAPGERIAMGFIGVGGQGGGHLLGGAWTYVAGGYAGRKDVQVLAVCDVWRDRRENACKKVNDHYAEACGKGSYKSCEPCANFRGFWHRRGTRRGAAGTGSVAARQSHPDVARPIACRSSSGPGRTGARAR